MTNGKRSKALSWRFARPCRVIALQERQRLLAKAGDVIDVSPDSSTNCRIEVVSFNILESLATVSATCVAAKH